jgi:hypothetical protein
MLEFGTAIVNVMFVAKKKIGVRKANEGHI